MQENHDADAAAEPDEPTGRRILGIRLRVIILLLALQAIFMSWVADSEISRSVYLICYSLMMPTVLYLIVARFVSPKLFHPKELILVYIVLTATIPIMGFGGLRFLLPGMGYMSYFSTTQPVWNQYLFQLSHLPVLHDPEAARQFFQGRSPVPWKAWVGPISFWSVYLLLLSGAWLGLAAALRRLWIREERLSFPVASVAIQIADRKSGLWRNPILWFGIIVPVVLQSLLQLQTFWPGLPAIQLTARDVRASLFTTPPWNAIPSLAVGYYPAAIGLAYFVPSDITFSCWFFWLVAKLSYVFGAAAGLNGGSISTDRFPYQEEQAAGAWIAFALLALWSARKQWGRSSVGGALIRDSLVPVGVALVCLLLCGAMMTVAGVAPLIAFGTIFIYAAYVLCGARVRAEAGALWTFAPVQWTPGKTMSSLAGTTGLSQHSLLASGYFDLVHVDIRGQSLPYLMEGLKIAEETGVKWRTVLTWVAIGTLSALALGWWTSLTTFYHVGAATAHGNVYVMTKTQIRMTQINSAIHNPQGPDHAGAGAMLFAAGFTILLAALRMKLVFFPFHPVGYVLANTLTLSSFAVPFFIAWLAKTLVLRYGQMTLHRRVVPFFLGLVVGDIAVQSFWTLMGRIFGWPVYQFLS